MKRILLCVVLVLLFGSSVKAEYRLKAPKVSAWADPYRLTIKCEVDRKYNEKLCDGYTGFHSAVSVGYRKGKSDKITWVANTRYPFGAYTNTEYFSTTKLNNARVMCVQASIVYDCEDGFMAAERGELPKVSKNSTVWVVPSPAFYQYYTRNSYPVFVLRLIDGVDKYGIYMRKHGTKKWYKVKTTKKDLVIIKKFRGKKVNLKKNKYDILMIAYAKINGKWHHSSKKSYFVIARSDFVTFNDDYVLKLVPKKLRSPIEEYGNNDWYVSEDY